MMEWINFILFVGVLAYFLREPLLDFLGDRSERIHQELEKIAKQKKVIEARLEDYKKRLDIAGLEIENLKKEFQSEGETEKKNLIQKAQKYSEKIREDAKRMTEQELNKARHILRRKTFLLAVDLAQKKLQQEVGPADQERLARWGIGHLERVKGARTGIS
ncbi:MAG: ATP synthase F0 subunit B [Deltaproteobacteria bacterium]|nr:ATP synthase F0 subunit B [Deltaproteobacteria bacterium]